MYLPASTLEMLYLLRRSPKSQLRVAAVSDTKLKNGGTVLAVLQQDVGKYSTEYLYSTSEGLIGARGLYNFGYDPRQKPKQVDEEMEYPDPSVFEDAVMLPTGRLSMGAEVYYGVLNKSGGSTSPFIPCYPEISINTYNQCPPPYDTQPSPITLAHH